MFKRITVILALIAIAFFVLWLFAAMFWCAMNDMPKQLDPLLNEGLAYIILYMAIVSFMLPIAYRKEIKKHINTLY